MVTVPNPVMWNSKFEKCIFRLNSLNLQFRLVLKVINMAKVMWKLNKSLTYEKVNLSPGDVVFFNSKCPHRSSKNNSNKDRRTIYYTYNKVSDGDNYQKYFDDKYSSKNKNSKSLSGQI